jgi:hypothetical protein
MAGQHWYLDSESGGYNQNAWKAIYGFSGANGSWLSNQSWSAAEDSLFLGGETAMWGEGINVDNFDAFVWRGTAAASERLWASEERVGCPATAPAADAAYQQRGGPATGRRTAALLGASTATCPGIKRGAGAGGGLGGGPPSFWLLNPNNGYGPQRLVDQLCRMSQSGIPTGPIGPGFCPSDVAAAAAPTAAPTSASRLAIENEALRRALVEVRHELAQLQMQLLVQ